MRAKEFTFNQPRHMLNISELIKRGAIFITHPHGPNGWETDRPDWDFSLITLQNVLQKSPDWVVDYKKYITKDKKLTQDFINKLSDQKYQQILWSIQKLGIPDSLAFLDKQGVAEGSGFEQEAGIGLDGQSFKFKIKDLVDLADKYPVTSINPNQFVQQIKDRNEDPAQSMARAEKADLEYPIIVVQKTNGKLWIADGTHRAHKAILNKIPKIKAKVIPIKDMSIFAVKQDVNEAPLPADWDKEKLNLRQTYKNRIKYALERAKRLGGGSARVSMIIDYEGRPTVLKVAKNYKGLKQNQAELDILDDGYLGNLPIVIPLIDYDKENNQPVWIQTELAKRITAPTLMKMLHTPNMWLFMNQVRNILGRRKPHEMDDKKIKEVYFRGTERNFKATEQGYEIFKEYASEVADLVSNSSLELGDLNAASNWGIYNDRPVIVDLGLSEEVWKKYYLAGKYGKNSPR